MRALLFLYFYFLILLPLNGQTVFSVYWNMQTLMPTNSTGSNLQASELSPGNNYGNTQLLSGSSSSLGAYSGASGEQNAALAARAGPLDKGVNGSAFLAFTIAASPGYKVCVNEITLGVRSTTTGPQQISLYSNVDGFQDPIVAKTILSNSEWGFYVLSFPALPSKAAIDFRLFGYEGIGNPAINVANWRLDDLRVQGLVIPESLPVQWHDFIIHPQENGFNLKWATTEERNNKGFTICRSTNGINYHAIGFVQANNSGFGSSLRHYQFLDSFPLMGAIFYKIQQVDTDGTIRDGPIRYVQQDYNRQSVGLFKNFIIQPTAICFSYLVKGNTTFSLYSIDGIMMGKSTYQFSEKRVESIQIKVNVGSLKTGLYLLTSESEGRHLIKKIMIIR